MAAMKPYTPPQIVEVPLRQEQAVLVTCISTASSAATSTSGTAGHCLGTCKKGAGGGQNGVYAAS
jgi:hypothetical protein